jgi:hypothetical protein
LRPALGHTFFKTHRRSEKTLIFQEIAAGPEYAAFTFWSEELPSFAILAATIC